MALWGGLGQAATVAQLVGADVGGLISMIIRAALTAQQNKKECEQLARRVFTIAELLQHLQDPEVLRRRLTGLDDTLREVHELVMECQEKNAVYRLVMAGRQADKFRDVQSRIDSYLLLFPVISHIDITRRLERIYNILVPNDTAGPSASVSMPQIPVQPSQFVLGSKRNMEFLLFNLLLCEHLVSLQRSIGKKAMRSRCLLSRTKASSNFSPARKIGQGGFGSVYMGKLHDGREVAIKYGIVNSYESRRAFVAELTALSSIRCKHIVPLYGYCVLVQEKRGLRRKEEEGEKRLLVYEYMENGSLNDHLNGSSSSSPSYAERPVIHRDVKSSNILLDASWAPRLTDFGLALPWEGPDHQVDDISGTFRYMAPEYLMTGVINMTTDVYSFGVVALEPRTARTAGDQAEAGSIGSAATPGVEGSYGVGDRIGSAGDENGDTPGDRETATVVAIGSAAGAGMGCGRGADRNRSDTMKAFATLSNFFVYVRTQFGTTIKSVQCDNGREFDNSPARTFFLPSRGRSTVARIATEVDGTRAANGGEARRRPGHRRSHAPNPSPAYFPSTMSTTTTTS
uniref:Protein kinase domain-containing protein n=1 Tax=Oryza brachyantha TaxID=4533 RepID=J3NA21_ORYBR